MYDDELMIRNTIAGNLVATEAAIPAVPLDMGPNLVPTTFRLIVPAIAAPADTLDVTILGSPDGGVTWETAGVFPQITGAGAPGEYFTTIKRPYALIQATLTVAGVAPNFGVVLLGPVTGGRYDHW